RRLVEERIADGLAAAVVRARLLLRDVGIVLDDVAALHCRPGRLRRQRGDGDHAECEYPTHHVLPRSPERLALPVDSRSPERLALPVDSRSPESPARPEASRSPATPAPLNGSRSRLTPARLKGSRARLTPARLKGSRYRLTPARLKGSRYQLTPARLKGSRSGRRIRRQPVARGF